MNENAQLAIKAVAGLTVVAIVAARSLERRKLKKAKNAMANATTSTERVEILKSVM